MGCIPFVFRFGQSNAHFVTLWEASVRCGFSFFGMVLEIGLEPIQCGANERRARRLDGAHP